MLYSVLHEMNYTELMMLMKKKHAHISQQQMAEVGIIAGLITGFTCQSLSWEEHNKLDEWVAANDNNMRLFETLTDDRKLLMELDVFNQVETETANVRKKLKRKLHFSNTRFPRWSF